MAIDQAKSTGYALFENGILIDYGMIELGKKNDIIDVKGIMIHSTGANNPNLRRYVGPDDGLLGINQHNNHWNIEHPDGRNIGAHPFVAGSNGRCATCGGRANDTHVSFEICEDGLSDRDYFDKVYQEAVDLCVHLCRMFKLDPMGDGVIIDHAEGHRRGIAGNHSDVGHWFPRHGKNMNTFRNDVKNALAGAAQVPEPIMPDKPILQDAPARTFPISEANIIAMVDLGIMNSPDYWRHFALVFVICLRHNTTHTAQPKVF